MNGQILIEGTYQILKEIGSGSGGTVFLAYHNRLEKNVVLKKISAGAQKFLDIRAEADILKNLHHPNLPQVFDFVKTVDSNGDPVVYTVMDFIPGKSFEDLLKEGAKFTPTQVAKYTVQLCKAVQYLHSQKPPILHGDIKPANVMLTPDDNICLIDFNISGFSDDLEVVGFTRGYASPEQCRAALETKERRKQAAPPHGFPSGIGPYGGDDKTVLSDEDETVLEDDDVTVIDDRPPQSAAGFPKESEKGRKENAERTSTVRIDQRSDIFSIGATAYCLLLGKKPDAVYENQIPISKQKFKVSDGLAFVIDKAMQLEPKKRFQTVSEMIRALSSLGKKDKRYKRLVLKQAIFCTFFLILASVSAITAYSGYRIMREDLADRNYAQALALYESREYDETLKYILSEALDDERIYNMETLGNLYYLAAESYFETEQYDSSVKYYEKALKCNSASAEYYCNYAIALVRLDRTDLAKLVIESAVRRGISDDRLHLMQGELVAAEGNTAEAELHFRECIDQTSDPYVLARAYMMFSDLYENMDGYSTDMSLMEKNIGILTEARLNTEEMYLPIILERLMQSYADFAEFSGNDTYIQYAIEAGRELIDLGWATFNNYMNLALMYSEVEQYEASKTVYGDMLQKFGDNYKIYKRLAFLELEIQDQFDIAEREYSLFKDYYDRAVELFAASGERKDSDTEMQLLEESYRSVVDGGWLDGERSKK